MFKKKPSIKPLAPLRSSDRRKIADKIIQEYSISVPETPAAQPEVDETSAQPTTTAPSLSSIRNSLLPENTLAGRFSTTVGPDLRPVHGTLYVGTHPDGEERVLWIKLEQGPGTDGRIYPTVYSLWHNPGLVPLLCTTGHVMEKLYNGADLMTPGLTNGPPFPKGAVKGSVVAVSSLDKPSVPTFVGVCEIDVAGLTQVQGAKGHAVRGIQWEGDELWGWGSAGKPGQPSPDHLDGWIGETEEAEEKLQELELGDDEDLYGGMDGGVPINEAQEEQQAEEGEEEEQEELPPPTTKGKDYQVLHSQSNSNKAKMLEIDDAFEKAFLYALYQHKKDHPGDQNHGLSFPIQPSFLISNLITPFLPIFSPNQAQYYQIKKTSWKNVKKFVKHLDKIKLLKSKDRGGETIVMDVDFNDMLVEQFVPYRLPKKTSSGGAKPKPASENAAASMSSEQVNVKTLYRPSSKLVPDLFPPLSNTDVNNYYSASDVSKRLNDYISSQDPSIISPSNPRILTLNAFISNKIISSNDIGTLSRGTIPRDALLKKLLDDPSLCAPFHAILKPNQTLSDVKPKPGALPKATITIERRTGLKLGTKVAGLDRFGISPQLLADELSKKCASSTSVSQAVGGAKGEMEVFLQGDHRGVVEKLLVSRGLKSQWISIVDKSKKK
ncbi:translation machinery-associated protein 64 [Nannizzia gypsea CBS 118893]|uniref:Translation machinery-associated protein 64 n=1 Tax=Arthroderma gypseum (strain ATCC MYA-4604 / CBS 118893) TaxID=535722 RepID=E5R3G6_ARTGP|nr:translation machinery-associated protein 64 [Nannizzia gypsea CBS 118893]EFQ98765.1 translation machinery-associated protein 64 [Nannizzia gypsea CBS 118893]